MERKIEELEKQAFSELNEARTLEELKSARVRYLGKKGGLTAMLRTLGTLSPEERKRLGRLANDLKEQLEKKLEEKAVEIRNLSLDRQPGQAVIDLSLPGRCTPRGHRHPLTQTLQDLVDIFRGMGFRVAEGPEVELDYYNFEALNIPREHPARDMQDTFYVTDDIVLRTQTSPVQVRTMERESPPIRMISPGKVYRHDADVTHSPMFIQIEGLMVDRDVAFSDLCGVLNAFLHEFFGPETQMRFRPSFLPFTEPSAEVDIRCVICKGSGCRVCSGSGWLEILGAGMVDPAVFRFVGYDPEEVQGFAFGLGVERLAMLRHGIDDIRLFYENDLRFLSQF